MSPRAGLVVALAVLGGSGHGHAESTPEGQEETRQLVVMLRCQLQGIEQIGAGIIVGKANDRLYIVTANHTVRFGDERATALQVQLRALPGEPLPATLLTDFDGKKDLAVIGVSGLRARGLDQLALPFDRLGDAAALARGDPVFSLGYPQGKAWGANLAPDALLGLTGDALTFQSSYVTAGHSGGALLNDRGEIVGLLLRVAPPEATAGRIDGVLDQLQKWGYPVALRRRFSDPSLETLTVGGGFTCWISPKASAWCWGRNADGELGNGTIANSGVPVAVQGRLKMVAISAGYWFACGITVDGIVYCWGNDGGDMHNGDVVDSRTPARVAGKLRFVSISAGFGHVCAVTIDGAGYCWGSNADGQLGSGTRTSSTAPVPVAGGRSFKSISAGVSHTCGIVADGRAYCWGENNGGALGNGSEHASSVPVPVSGKLTFAAISAGNGYTCGLTPAGGGFCWGNNDDGQLGDGTQRKSRAPIAIAGKHRFQSLSTGKFGGRRTTCAVDTGGQTYCWGFDNESSGGAEWDGGPGRVVGDAQLTRVNAAGHVCGLAANGVVYCWGSGRYGQLGDSSTGDRITPRIVPLPP